MDHEPKRQSQLTQRDVDAAVAVQARLDALRATGLLDEPPSETFDRLVDLATKLLDVPTAVVTLVEPERQFFLAGLGIGEPWKGQRGTPISHSFCKYVVASESDLVVDDARENPLVKDNPAIEELDVIAYAGTPLKLSSGEVLGSFCAIDHEPRHWSPTQIEALQTLASATMAEIELRLATRALSEREQRFRGALEEIRAFAVTLDADARVTFVNDYFLEITGWTRDEVLGHDWFQFTGDDGERRELFKTRVADGSLVSHNDGHVLTKSGDRRLVSWDNIGLRDTDGRVHGVAGIGHDVTVQREAERMKDELISIVSHELRGPLTSIRASLRLVEPQITSVDDRVRRMIAIAARSTDRLVGVVNDLLDFDRIESGSLPMERARVSTKQIVAQACDESGPLADEAGVSLVANTNCECTIDVDSGRTVQALTNLIRNAISFSPKGGKVEVSCTRRDGVAELSVRDQGRGIPADKLGAIFERFKQVEVSDHKSRTGSGLGLAISRAIVEQQGGSIAVESELGKGSVFKIHFPIAPS